MALTFFNRVPKMRGADWSVFYELHGHSGLEEIEEDKIMGIDRGQSYEIIRANRSKSEKALAGFSLWGYLKRAKDNEKRGKLANRKKEVRLIDREDIDEGDSPITYGEVSSQVISLEESGFAEFEDRETYKSNFKTLINLRHDVLLEYGYDVVVVLYNALKEVPESIILLMENVKEDNPCGCWDLIEELLEIGSNLTEDLAPYVEK